MTTLVLAMQPTTFPSKIEVLDPRFASVADGAGPMERVCIGTVWSEGPMWMRGTGDALRHRCIALTTRGAVM